MTPKLSTISTLGASLITTAAISQTIPANVAGVTLTPDGVVAIVKVPKPWCAPKSVVVKKMQATVTQYEELPGLSHKVFTLTQLDAQFGGIYLWTDRATAQTWFGPAWHERVLAERGQAANVRIFPVPVVVDNPNAAPGQ